MPGRAGTPLAPGGGVRILPISSAIFIVLLCPALAHAQSDWDDGSEDAEVGADEEQEAADESAADVPDEPQSEAAGTEAPVPKARESEVPPPPPPPKGAKATKVEADTVIILQGQGESAAEQPPKPKPRPGRVHDGFYLRGSIGHGWMGTKFSEGLLAERRLGGQSGAFDIQLGGSPSPGLALGGGLFISGMEHEDVRRFGDTEGGDPGTVGMLAVGPFIDYFPDPKGGFHFGGMLGLGALAFETADDDDVEASFDDDERGGGGGAIGAWVGYDWWIGREWSLGVQLRYLGAAVKNQDHDWRGAADSVALQFTALYH